MKVLFGIWFLFLLLATAAFSPVSAQQPVYTIRINVQIAPPYPPYLDDYKNKAIVSFTNLSQTPADIYLRGKVSNDRGEFIQTKPNVFTLIPIHVPALQTIVLQGGQVDGSYLDLNNLQTNLSNTEYANLFQLGLMPEGFYTFCLYAYTRNANGNYIPVSDPQAGSTCSMFNVGYVVPPTIINPLDQSNTTPTPNQNLIVQWTRPAGNLQGAHLVYDLYIVKVIQGEDPNTATNASVQYGAGIFYKQANIIGPGFQFSNLTGFPLEDGSTYALMVQAKDLNGKTAFENNGMSAVVTMTYGAAPSPFSTPMTTLDLVTTNCPCKKDLSNVDPTNANQSLQAGLTFTMNDLTVKISTLNPLNADGSVNGYGTVLIDHLPVTIQFQNVVVSPDHIATAGTVTGSSPDFGSLLGGAGPPTLSSNDFQSFIDQISKYNINDPLNAAGVTLPIGLNNVGVPDQANLAITALSITPTQSTYDAVAVVQLADAQHVLVLGASNVCFSNSSLFCKSAYFHLLQDFNLPEINLIIKAQNGADSGTYAIDDNGTITAFNLEAAYTFPTSILVRPDGSPATAILKGDMRKGWSDFIATVSIDPFVVTAASSVVFTSGTAIYDHSSVRNATGMPASLADADLAEKNPQIAVPSWQGFYLPSIMGSLPAIVKNINSPDDSLRISATTFFIDDGGVTGVLQATDVISLGNGALAGSWYCSLDQINLKFLNSSYKTGGFSGKVVMPFSDTSNQSSRLDYSCTLSTGGGSSGLSFQFVAKLANGVDFSAWWADMDISACTIQVTNTGNKFKASADLSGNLNFRPQVGDFSTSFQLVSVQDLVVQTDNPYVSYKSFVAGLSSPQHQLDGFNVSLGNITPRIDPIGSSVGLHFDLTIGLVDALSDKGLTATGGLLVAAKVAGPRNLWSRVSVTADSIAVDGELPIGEIKGTIQFINNDPIFGNCVKGSLKAWFRGIDVDPTGIDAHVMFGNNGFNYWYVDANAKFPPIPVAPGLSINSLGGGGYYNMKHNVDSSTVDQVFARNFLKDLDNYVMDQFIPMSGFVGFKARIGVSSNDGYLYSGYGEIGMEFDLNGGFSLSGIDLTFYAEMLKAASDITEDPNSVMQGMISGHIGLTPKPVFSLIGALDFAYPPADLSIISGHAAFALLADQNKGDYFFKLGTPDNRNDLKVMGALDFSSYFMAGTSVNAAIPPPDPSIVDPSLIKGYMPSYDPNNPPGGIVFGATFNFHQDLNYLVFYIDIGMGVGFDMSMAHYKNGCAGPNGSGSGANNWYAVGQVYAGLKGEIGLGVDLWFFKGNVAAGSVDAGVILSAGLPSPNWFQGIAYLQFNALGGQISGTVSFRVKIGETCIPNDSMGLALPLIQEFKPLDQVTNVPINTNPEVIFNYTADQPFDVLIPRTDGSGNDDLHTYQLDIQQCQIVNTADGSVWATYKGINNTSYAEFQDNLHKDLMVTNLNAAMQPQTIYTFTVQVKAQELINDIPTDLNLDTTAAITFKTGDCRLDDIITNPTSRLGAFPFPNQRYFLQGESPRGAILLDRPYACLSSSADSVQLIARFTAVKNHRGLAVVEKPVNIATGINKLTYDIPQMPNDCMVRVEFIKRVTYTSKDNYTLFAGNLTSLTTANRSLSQNPMAQLTLNSAAMKIASTGASTQPNLQGVTFSSFNTNHQLNLGNKTVDIVLYSYHYRTSRFNTLADKLKNISFVSTKSYDEFWLGGGSPTVNMQAVERFDEYDVNGFVSGSYPGGIMQFSLPLTLFRESPASNPWMMTYAKPCIYFTITGTLGLDLNSLRTGGANQTNYDYLQKVGFACDGTGPCIPKGPIEIQPGTVDPQLSAAEITADEIPAYMQALQGGSLFLAPTAVAGQSTTSGPSVQKTSPTRTINKTPIK